MTSKWTSALQARRPSRPSTGALIELPAPPTSFRRSVGVTAASSLLAFEERPPVAESPSTIRTPVPISSPTPKALLSSPKTLDSGYESKLKGPQIDYFSIEQPGTTTAENGDAPLASPQPLHLDHRSSLPSLVEMVTLAPKQDTFAELALLVPRAATDSSLVLSNPKLVANDSVWDGGQDHIDLETVTSDRSEESEVGLRIPRAATDSALLLSNPKLVADDTVWEDGDGHQIGFETVTSDKSEESEESFMCRTSAAFERLTVARIILKGDLDGGDSPLDRRMSM